MQVVHDAVVVAPVSGFTSLGRPFRNRVKHPQQQHVLLRNPSFAGSGSGTISYRRGLPLTVVPVLYGDLYQHHQYHPNNHQLYTTNHHPQLSQTHFQPHPPSHHPPLYRNASGGSSTVKSSGSSSSNASNCSCLECCSRDVISERTLAERRHSCSVLWSLPPGPPFSSRPGKAAFSTSGSPFSPSKTPAVTNPNFFALSSSLNASYSYSATPLPSPLLLSNLTHSLTATISTSTAQSNNHTTANNSANITTASAAGHPSWIRNFDVVLTKRNSAHLSPSSSSVPLENYL